MKWLKGLRLSLVALGLSICAGLIVIAFNPHWIKIESVELEMPLSSKEDLLFQRIRTTLDPQFQRFEGRFFWDVSLKQVYELVSKDRRVRKVSVYREFPNRLRVEIEPHTPVLAYLSSDNRFYPVAKDATLLPALPLKDVSDLPIIRGEELKDEQKLRESAIELFEQIPLEGALRRSAVSEMLYTKKDGFKIFIANVDGEIKMGDSDFGPKLSRVEKVLSYLESQNIKGRVIDARFNKKVVVRVRNTP